MVTTKKDMAAAQPDDTVLPVQTVETVETVSKQPVVVAQKQEMNRQTLLTIAIVSSVVLFFIGMGLGYMLGAQGNTGRSDRTRMMDDYPRNFNRDNYRRGLYNQNNQTQPSTNNNSNGSTQTTPQTQSN